MNRKQMTRTASRAAAAASAALLLTGAWVGNAQETSVNTVPSGEREAVALTIYNQGTALVRDRRTYDLAVGENVLNFTDVAAGIDATSVQFRSLTDPEGTSVLEQSYLFDLVDSFTLLNRYIDQTISLIASDGTEYTGQLLSARNGDIILRTDGGQIVVINQSQIRDVRFPELPGGLITRPTLRWLLQSGTDGAQQVELTYLTSGMNWTADYVLLLQPEGTQLDLNGWITLTNTSGATFTDAQVKLVAGDVNRLPEPEGRMYAMDAMSVNEAAAAPPVEQRDFNEYKLYEITRPVTVADNETKQVEFVSGTDITSATFFVYDASTPYYYGGGPITDQYYGTTGITDVQNYLEFTTGAESGLDAALPAGRIRVYQEDTDGAALLIGENTIDHTARGERVQVYLGNAFDLVGERTQTAFNILAPGVIEETYSINLRNRKQTGDVEVRVPEHLFRWSNWEILASSQPYTQLDSSTIEFRANVAASGETTITYTVRYTYPQ